VILADKPAGITSFQTLGAIKKVAGTRKVGHAGTLDKFATGLLIVFTGWTTRLVPWFTGLDKRYIAEIRFGEETDTLDPEGEIVATSGIPSESEIRQAVAELTGTIDQVPPIYSAIHTGGERAHRLARAGKEVKLASRQVEIYSSELLVFDSPHATIGVHCSKGTYIRSLARDIGRVAGSVAHVRGLRRINVGPFSVDQAKPPSDLDLGDATILPADALAELGTMLRTTVPPEAEAAMRNGRRIDPAVLGRVPDEGEEAFVVDSGGGMIAIVQRQGDECSYRLVVPQGALK
jgi:tRNA pseudouridine55 synthase